MLVKHTKPSEVNLSLSIGFTVLWKKIRPRVTFCLSVSRRCGDRYRHIGRRRAREVYRDRLIKRNGYTADDRIRYTWVERRICVDIKTDIERRFLKSCDAV